MLSSDNLYCRQVVDILLKHDVRTAYCSPGSRNAPLLVALEGCAGIFKHVVVDERSAAFQALGCSLVDRRPVMLVCTSGTAVLNYAPAVAEAYYSGIPLIVVSADRPREWIDQDDSQTIRQYGVLDHIVKGSYDIRAIADGTSFSDDLRWTVNRTVNEAMHRALDGKPGPVHINVQLSDPLGGIAEVEAQGERIVSLIRSSDSVPADLLREMAGEFAESRVMLVAGFLQPDHRLDRAVRSLASLPNVAVFAETISNLHDPQPGSSVIDTVLCDLSDKEKEDLRPDIVVTIGGALVSRMLKQYLRDYPPHRHWSVGHSNYFCDCFRSLTDRIDISPASFFRQLNGALRKCRQCSISDYASQWQEKRVSAVSAAHRYIKDAPWSDLKAFDYLFRKMQFDNLFVSNGTAIRYSQLIAHSCHAEYCNRGVSGIDGSTSTAVGGAKEYPGQTALITGDMSWLYDSGASALSDIPSDMRMIVMDNSGGGIFRFIKSTSSIPATTLEKYFCVSDLPDIEVIAGAYGIEVEEATDMESLREGVAWLSESLDLPRMLIVRTPAEESAGVLKGYFTKARP